MNPTGEKSLRDGPAWLAARWPAPAHVRAGCTQRAGGVSLGRWGTLAGQPGDGGGLNLGMHTGDDPSAVAANRRMLTQGLPGEPVWLQQTHGVAVHLANPDQGLSSESSADPMAGPPNADAAVTSRPGVVLAILTADCLPVLITDREGSVVAAAHAGWRGLAGGVIENTVAAARRLAPASADWMAWLGPAIGPLAFEVGADVRDAFLADDPRAAGGFASEHAPGRWMADLVWLARLRLARIGVRSVHALDACTVGEPSRFYSYRRDGVTGRMASLIWMDPAG